MCFLINRLAVIGAMDFQIMSAINCIGNGDKLPYFNAIIHVFSYIV